MRAAFVSPIVHSPFTLPTFDVASVKLFRVVDFPLDGWAPHLVSGVGSGHAYRLWRTDLAHQSDERIAWHIE